MRDSKLPNYLRSHRKRLGLTQDELAFLLCLHSGSKVCRYEQYRQHPSLKTALAYQVVFRASAQELFAGMFQAIQSSSQKRANLLLGGPVGVQLGSALKYLKLEDYRI